MMWTQSTGPIIFKDKTSLSKYPAFRKSLFVLGLMHNAFKTRAYGFLQQLKQKKVQDLHRS